MDTLVRNVEWIGVPLCGNPITIVNAGAEQTFDLFDVQGSGVQIFGIWGVVETVLGAALTAASIRLWDGSSAQAITLASPGATISSLPVGSMIIKDSLATANATVVSAAAGVVSEPATAGIQKLSPFIAVKKSTAQTKIQFLVTDAGAGSGVIRFHCYWAPLDRMSSMLVPL